MDSKPSGVPYDDVGAEVWHAPIKDPERTGMKCTYCEREMIRRRAATGPRIGLAKTKDHIWPASRGGKKTVVACYTCNHAKSDMAPEIWELFMLENPEWWLLEKRDLRKARKLAVRMTAKIMETASAVGAIRSSDWSKQREHWKLIARLAKADYVVSISP